MMMIPLTRGAVAIVDASDFPVLSAYKWRLQKCGSGLDYAVRSSPRNKGEKRTEILMHREIMCCPKRLTVDHINKNGLDNRRSNLRIATQSQNNANALSRRKTRSGLRGVTPDERSGGRRWLARLSVNNQLVLLGTFSSAEEAHSAYVSSHINHHGEFSSYWAGRNE